MSEPAKLNVNPDEEGQQVKKNIEGIDYINRHYKCQAIVFSCLQVLSMVLYGLCTEFDTSVAPSLTTDDGVIDIDALKELIETENPVRQYYPVYQDVHVMIFVGFGFLMVFLRRNMWSSVAFNFLLAAWTIQVGILWVGFWHCVFAGHWAKIQVNLVMLIEGDFAAGAVLISFGAVLGKVNSMQLLLMSTFEIFFYALNFQIGATVFEAVDMGGSMFVHTFGAYFGLAVTKMVTPIATARDHKKCVGGYVSQTIAMVGTIFLWMFWPSFNGALAEGNSQHRVIVNTVLALTASCMSAFLASSLFHQGRFNMEHVLNATLAGGVIIGSSSDLVLDSVFALLIGFIGGFASAVGFSKLSPWLASKGIHDTCGVNNLHGIPGVLGGAIGALSAAVAPDVVYGEDIGNVFPARGEGRSASGQGQAQAAALGVTLLISIFGGLLTGGIIKNFSQPEKAEHLYEDGVYWVEAEEEEEN